MDRERPLRAASSTTYRTVPLPIVKVMDQRWVLKRLPCRPKETGEPERERERAKGARFSEDGVGWPWHFCAQRARARGRKHPSSVAGATMGRICTSTGTLSYTIIRPSSCHPCARRLCAVALSLQCSCSKAVFPKTNSALGGPQALILIRHLSTKYDTVRSLVSVLGKAAA